MSKRSYQRATHELRPVKITKDGLEVDNQGKPAKKGTIKNPAFATAFLMIFFGKNPADERFQRQLIGGER